MGVTIFLTIFGVFLFLALAITPFVSKEKPSKSAGQHAATAGIGLMFDAFASIPSLLRSLFLCVAGASGLVALVIYLFS